MSILYIVIHTRNAQHRSQQIKEQREKKTHLYSLNQHQIGTHYMRANEFVSCFFFFFSSFSLRKLRVLSPESYAYTIHTHTQKLNNNSNNNDEKNIFFYIHFNLLRTNFELKVRFIWPYKTSLRFMCICNFFFFWL